MAGARIRDVLLRECGIADNADHIIVTSWNAKLPDLIKEFCLANKEKIENNKALFDVRDEIFALRINEDCLLNFLRSCCCKCNLKDAGDATCGNGEYVANKHGYCSDFARK